MQLAVVFELATAVGFIAPPATAHQPLAPNGCTLGIQKSEPEPAPTVTLGKENVIRLQPRSTTQKREFRTLLTIFDLPDSLRTAKPEIIDQLLDFGTTKVSFVVGEQLQSEKTAVWIVDGVAEDLPNNASQERMAQVKIGSRGFARSFTLTDRLATPVKLTVQQPAVPWITRWNGQPSPLAIAVTTADQPVTGLRVAQSTLQDATGLQQLGPERFELVDEDETSIGAMETKTVLLMIRPEGWSRPHGKFTGAISFAVDQVPELSSVAVTLHATSWVSKFAGAALLGLGLALSWLLLSRIRPLSARWQALRPVLLLRQAIDDMSDELTRALDQTDRTMPQTRERLRRLRDNLETAQLDADNLLPPSIASIAGPSTDASVRLQRKLAEVSGELAAVAATIRRGIGPAIAAWRAAGTPERQAIVAGVLNDLDTLGATSATQAEALTQIPAMMGKLQAGIGTESLGALDPISLEQATFLIERASLMAWAIWGLVAFVTGCAVLILPNAAFGAPLDYVYCFLWGVGLPSAGVTLQSATPASVATTIGIPVPKPGP